MRTTSLIMTGTAALLIALVPASARAQVPGQIPIQGYLTDAEGEPYDAEVAINFTLYDAATGGAELFGERQTIIVDRGVFSAYLGTVEDLDLGIFRDNPNVYLGVQVGADAEASPRLRFAAVPWAAYADDAATFGGVAASELPTVVEEWAREACLDTEEELTALLDDNYANPAWDNITGIPEDIADGDDGFTTEEELTWLLDDNYLPADYEPDPPAWAALTGVPAGFADGLDDDTTYTAAEPIVLDGETFGLSGEGCEAGEALTWNGTGWECAPDSDTTYTAGDGLELSGTELSLDEEHMNGSAHDDRFVNADGDEMTGDLVLEENTVIRRVQRTVGYGADGRDSGYLSGRRLVFDKSRDDTWVRVTWSDNRRGMGYIYGYWEIYFNRQPCTDPGPVRFWLHSNAGSSYNDNHYTATFVGYCRATSAGPMRAGEYAIEIQVHHQGGNRSDWYVGWNGSTQFVLEAEEVY